MYKKIIPIIISSLLFSPNISNSFEYKKQPIKSFEQMINESFLPFIRENESLGIYNVEKGDNMSIVLNTTGTTLERILKLNPNIKDPNIISTGILFFPYTEEKMNGYKPGIYDYNKKRLFNRNGEEFVKDRERFGIDGLTFLTGIKKGTYCDDTEQSINNVLKIKNVLDKYSKKYNLDTNILPSIVRMESGGIDTISRRGALGYFALTKYLYDEGNWSDYKNRKPINPFNLEESTDRSADYLSLLIKKYGLKLGITAYNVGEVEMNKLIRTYNNLKNKPEEILKTKLHGKFILSKEGRNYFNKFQNNYSVFNERVSLESSETP